MPFCVRRGIMEVDTNFGGGPVGTLLILAVGIVIGWNLPQPSWAKEAQDKLVAAIKNLINKP
jgi:hypothetical protein